MTALMRAVGAPPHGRPDSAKALALLADMLEWDIMRATDWVSPEPYIDTTTNSIDGTQSAAYRNWGADAHLSAASLIWLEMDMPSPLEGPAAALRLSSVLSVLPDALMMNLGYSEVTTDGVAFLRVAYRATGGNAMVCSHILRTLVHSIRDDLEMGGKPAQSLTREGCANCRDRLDTALLTLTPDDLDFDDDDLDPWGYMADDDNGADDDTDETEDTDDED